MAGYIENISLSIQTFSDAQASILDFLFPGFTSMSAVVQRCLTIELNVYVPLLCFFGLIMFRCGRICQYLWGLLETYLASTVHFRYREDAYDILLLWISSQSLAENAGSSLVNCRLCIFIEPLEK
ncbi:hypothetical protein OIDMADRAFT_108517 [Oidiodendron maius Zn]|uniref:BCS1 N-terminal domain-containing protein n=1 Tax=Oidiodendron maius (strain Zn) TaxID=913774 RepID=A0A0C3DZF6_OIDMZ|nr:hypothetical protein OIDMADRAFT_108517 [Oidiodendron maius Zn]